jgi:hypothetical protein
MKVASEPEALLAALKDPAYNFKRIGLEAGPLSQWLFSALAEAELPVICVETRHMQAVLKTQINRTDRNDARGDSGHLGGPLLILSEAVCDLGVNGADFLHPGLMGNDSGVQWGKAGQSGARP